jgi:MFS family permease
VEPLPTEERPSWRELGTRITVDVSPLRDYPDYRRLWIGQAITFVGSEMALVALPYQVWKLTHSTLVLGLFSLTELVPLLTLTLAGGAVADAIDRRRMVLITASLQAVGIVGLLVNAAFPRPSIVVVFVFATIVAGCFSAGIGAMRSIPQRLVPEEVYAQAGALDSIYYGLGGVAGPPLAGVLIATAGLSPLGLFPAIAARFGNATYLGALYAAPAAGALIAGLGSGWVAYVRRQGLIVVAAASLWGMAIVGFAYSDRFWLALVLVGLAGLADQVSAIFRNAMLLSLTPDRLLGRVRGIEFMQVASAPSLGNLEAGVVASLTSIRTSVASGGLLCVAGTLASAAAFPALLRYEARRVAAHA